MRVDGARLARGVRSVEVEVEMEVEVEVEVAYRLLVE